ncbi:MAG: 30S ribosome-binding factor RbfA [Bacillota bacterium]
MSSIRYDRMNEEIKKAISEVLREMKDPRIAAMTTILAVEVTNDLKWAKVRVSVYDQDQEAREETVAALNHASGFIARELGRRVQLRNIPRFKFLLDNSIEYSVHISKIIREINGPEKKEQDGSDS